MATFQKTLQKFFVYFFTGVSIFIVILGITRIKKGEPLAEATAPDQKSGASKAGLAIRGATQTEFKGKTYQTPWGNLAVAIKVKDGKVNAVTIPTLPDSPPSQEAKAYLIEQAIRSGSANIQGVTGATITSLAFKASLESALAQSANASSAFALNNIITPDTSNETSYPLPTSAEVSAPSTAANVAQTQTKAGINGTFTGNAYGTPWGNAVASVTITNGKITGVAMPTIPQSPPSIYAEPYLVQQALSAGSANIQGVSGATYASIAFKSSLESAIAKANATATAQGKATVAATPAQTSSAVSAQNTTSPAVPRNYRDDDDEEEEWEDEWDD